MLRASMSTTTSSEGLSSADNDDQTRAEGGDDESVSSDTKDGVLRRELTSLREKMARADAAHAADIERLIGEKQELVEETRVLRSHLAANAKRQKV